MKKWSSVILVLVLMAVQPFALSQPPVVAAPAVPEESCCCCSTEQKHNGSASCECDGCSQKNEQSCACAPTAPNFTAVLIKPNFYFPSFFTDLIFDPEPVYLRRTDSPLLRPPILLWPND